MNQKNGKNSLGLDSSFGEHDNPIDLFKNWFDKAKESEINDPNAVSLGTVDDKKQPSVRMVLLKGLSNEGFVFYTNFNSKKGSDLKKNHFASMCFHWKSLRRQVRVIGEVKQVSDLEADDYFNSRPYGNRIAAWASSQSKPMKNRNIFLDKIEEFKKKFSNEKKVPRPPHWSGWRIHPKEIEFWIDGESRVHERLNYILKESQWIKEILYP
ncbi:pyridoxamine 5'-phosphate oxidase [Pelagibacteraceae bacterium]|jgi:pyridoxamine 5'-phosphate oxidase|nr:pyridoxamine 5'-phosphate oxidase [Pelagibacteraceae bacterium]